MSFVAEVGGVEVVGSGVVFAKNGEEIILYPFGSDVGYKLIFILVIDDEATEPTNLTTIPGDTFTLKLVRPWLEGLPSVNLDVLIAQTEGDNFYMSFGLNVIGVVDRFAVQLSYAVQRKPK